MRLNDIRLLIHHHEHPGPAIGTDNEAYNRLLVNCLLTTSYLPGPKPGTVVEVKVGGMHKLTQGPFFIVTEKGRVFLNALQAVPLPVQAWTMPGKE